MPADDARVAQLLAAGKLAVNGRKCWGPPQWNAIHQLLRSYPDEPTDDQKAALKQYLSALATLLPCKECSEHFAQLAGGVDASSRAAALKWSIDTHNSVNKRLGKPVLDYDAATTAIENNCPSCTSGQCGQCDGWKIGTIVLGVVVVLLVAVTIVVGVRTRK